MAKTETECVCTAKDLFNFGCRCDGPPVLRVWHNGIDWVVAHSADEAREFLKNWACYDEECLDGDEGWSAWPDDKPISIHDGPDEDSITTLTGKEWAEECGEPQVLCSREY